MTKALETTTKLNPYEATHQELQESSKAWNVSLKQRDGLTNLIITLTSPEGIEQDVMLEINDGKVGIGVFSEFSDNPIIYVKSSIAEAYAFQTTQNPIGDDYVHFGENGIKFAKKAEFNEDLTLPIPGI